MKLLTTLLLILPLVTACASGPGKAELDAEVKRLCTIDGGVKVYETVVLPANRFDKLGNIRIPLKELAKPEDDYYYEMDDQYLKRGNPEMWRSHFKYFRRSDQALLGESVRYVRRGGDIPSPMHDSSFACPEIGVKPTLERLIFQMGDR